VDLSVRKASELTAKLHGLGRELEHWRAESGKGRRLVKHHSQIRRVSTELESFAGQIDARFGKAGDRLLADWPGIELELLDLHAIWGWFRSKLALRYVDWFSPYLVTADEFAWACYRPAQERAVERGLVRPEALREPPLLFFSELSTPFTIPRGHAYAHEVGRSLTTAEFTAVLDTLPVPVIGIPWPQIEHLPDALVIGHEVGHAVEHDLGLSPTLRGLLVDAVQAAGVCETHLEAWSSWLPELFADAYGCLAAGPAFTGALLDFLAADKATISNEQAVGPSWGAYPTAALRALVNLALLERSGFAKHSEDLAKAWRGMYPTHAMAAYGPDAPQVAKVLLDGPYPKIGPLSSLLSFPFQEEAEIDAARLLDRLRLPPLTTDVRSLLAAGRLAFARDSGAYGSQGVARRVLDTVVAAQTEATRFRSADLAAPPDPDLQRARDEQAGARLHGQLRRLRAGETGSSR
jgi:hypothetical protein